MDTEMTNREGLASFFLLDNLHSDRAVRTQTVFSLFLCCSPRHGALSLKLFYFPSHLSVLCSSTWTHMRQRNCIWYQRAVPWSKPHWERNPISDRPPQGSLSPLMKDFRIQEPVPHWQRVSFDFFTLYPLDYVLSGRIKLYSQVLWEFVCWLTRKGWRTHQKSSWKSATIGVCADTTGPYSIVSPAP